MSIASGFRVSSHLVLAGLACGLVLSAGQTAVAQNARPSAATAAAGATSRAFTWTGGDAIRISVPSNIRYTQGPAAQIVVSGPARLVERVELQDGRIRFDRPMMSVRDQLSITISLPNIRSFGLAGSQRLTIERYDQPELDLSISGSGKVTATGRTRTAKTSISGSGDIDLSRLALDESLVSISGSGSVIAGPRLLAQTRISGSGNVTLVSQPARVDTQVSGSGRVRQAPAAG